MNFREDFQLVAGFTMDTDLSEAVIETQALIAGQREALFEVARDRLLRRFFAKNGSAGGEKQNGGTEPG
jgi:hypothetical protein